MRLYRRHPIVRRLAFVVGMVSLAFVASSVARRGADEDTRARVQSAQVRSAEANLRTVVDLRGRALRSYVADYSLWEDMARFAETGDLRWSETNIRASMATFQVDGVWVYDARGVRKYPAGPRETLPGSARGVVGLLARGPLVHYFARDDEGTWWEVRGARILNESDVERTGPARGYFLAAVRWDGAYVDGFRTSTGGEPSLVDATASCAAPAADGLETVLGSDLPGVDDTPVARLCVHHPNEAAKLLAEASWTTFLTSLLFAGAVFTALSAALHVLVARPLKRLRSAIASGDLRELGELERQPNELGDLARVVAQHHRGEAERERLRAQVYQSGKLASLGVLGAGIAHELNNPLAAVLGHAELIAAACDDEPVDVADLRECASTIISQAERMRDIVDHVRQLSRSEGPPRLVPRDLNDVLLGALMFLKTHLRHRKITLLVKAAPGLPRVPCDPLLLESVIQNLVINASDELETLPDGAPRTIVVETLADASASVVKLRITDDGRGIPEPARERLFEPFFTTKAVGKGTGLGLALVHGLVAQHGGSVSFETSPEGTTFEVTLPALAAVAASHVEVGRAA